MDSPEIDVATVTETPRAAARGKSGFSLVEVIISSSIFLIVSIGFTAGMLAALKAHSMASQHYRATCLTRNHIQHARTLAFNSVQQMAKTNEWIDERGTIMAGQADGLFRRSTSVTNPAGMTDTVEVVVQIYFPVPFGRLAPSNVEMRTMITKER